MGKQIHAASPPDDTADVFGERLPWALVTVPADKAEYAVCNEAFAPILAIVELEADFFSTVVPYVNDVYGRLSCTVVAHPAVEVSEAAKFNAMICDLNFGQICINTWSGAGFAMPGATWGAFPGETLDAVQSGIGVVCNSHLFDKPQKTVVRSPFICEQHIGTKRNSKEKLCAIAKFLAEGGIVNMINMIMT